MLGNMVTRRSSEMDLMLEFSRFEILLLVSSEGRILALQRIEDSDDAPSMTLFRFPGSGMV